MTSDLTVALFVAYAALGVWRLSVAGVVGRPEGHALGYRRLGFYRLLGLTIERGGFQIVAPAPPPDNDVPPPTPSPH